jgi:dienelactone hydrolase
MISMTWNSRLNKRSLAIAAAVCALAASACSAALKLAKDDSPTVLAHQTITAPDPSEPGPYKFVHIYYGSGNDKQRSVFRDSVTFKTKPVDISPYVTVPPAAADDRKKFWGFDMKKVPLNARVWYPEGAGPFPLVLVVHGNHNPEDFSDPGYGYLGEQLASRGFILASIDENFINGLSGENDGRAWLLLKHLQEWKRWNDSTGSPLYHKVDLDNIALMGHSRGGEAAPLAATFNKLQFYPDDAKQKLGFNFKIKSVVSIAPVDGQYKPAGMFTPLENVNYLVIHGSHDGDVSTFTGLRQFERLRFTDGQQHFKAAFYMYRANHGQWNTVWNNKDNGPRSGRSLDLRALIAPEEQRKFAKLVISGFLEATLKGKKEYLPMFRDHRTAGHWFPKTMYITRFEESGYTPLAEYDEDVDVTTGSVPGVTLMGDSLGTWKEATLPYRSRGDDQRHNAVWIGWNNRSAGKDTTKMGKPASYTVTISDSLRAARAPTAQSAIYLSLAATKDKPGPRAGPKDTTKADTTKEGKARAKTLADSVKADSIAKAKAAPKPKKEEADTIPIEITLELADSAGHTARLPLSKFGTIRRPLETRVYRREGRDETRFATIFELVQQTFVIPLADFVKASATFDPTKLKTIRLLFDKTVAGTVVVSDIGLSAKIDPAYLAGSIP